MRIRRDPRTEREAHRVEASRRPRFDLRQTASALVAPRRPRRDPRREAAALLVPGAARPRIDRLHRGDAPAPSPTSAPSPAPRIRLVENPAFLVLAVADPLTSGALSTHDRQVIGAARALAGDSGAVVLLSEPLVGDAGPAGADRLLTLPDEAAHPESRAELAAAAIEALAPRHVLLPESSDGGDLARRLAVRFGEDLFAGAEQVSARSLVRTLRGRGMDQRAEPPRFISVEADRVAPYAGVAREGRRIDLPFPVPARRSAGALVRPDAGALPLAEADFVVAAGNGITDFESFHALVAALGATPGASRVLCDAGLMPRGAQVGASGTVLSANCYLALGIAGAPQHLQGIAGCRHVLAVNTDLHAKMIERADLAIVADAQKVMPALLKLLAEEGP